MPPLRTPPLRALLLDFGGTLALERTSRGRIYADAAREAGIPVAADDMARRMGVAHGALPREVDGAFRYSRPWFEAFIHHVFVVQLGLEEARLGPVQERLFARFADGETFRVFPDARELVAAARARGLGVAVVSNWSDALETLLRRLGLGPFDAVLSSAVERLEKPDPALFRRALARLGVEPAEALHVGDSLENDVAGARSAGVDAILLERSGRAAPPAGHPPTVRSLAQVVPLLDGAPPDPEPNP